MKTRVAAPELVVDLNRIDALRGIAEDGGALTIGAMTTYAAIVDSPEVAAARPILAQVARTIADVQVRNRGTIGGNVCSNDPTNHFPPLLAALEAELTIAGPDGERTVGTDEFFEGVYVTAVQPRRAADQGPHPGEGATHATAGRARRSARTAPGSSTSPRPSPAATPGSRSAASPRRRSSSPPAPTRPRSRDAVASADLDPPPTSTPPPTTVATSPGCWPPAP